MAVLTLLIPPRLLKSGGVLDSQTTDTQYFGFEPMMGEESQLVEVGKFEQEVPTKAEKMPAPNRELGDIIADICKTRDDLNALEHELVGACLAVANGGHKVRIHNNSAIYDVSNSRMYVDPRCTNLSTGGGGKA